MLVLAACAGTPSAPSATGAILSAEELVAKRSKERWDLMIAGRLGEAYDYLTPATRSQMDRESYEQRYQGRQVRWIAAEVTQVSCEGNEVCEVEVLLTTETHMPMAGSVRVPAPVLETWLNVDGDWYQRPVRRP